MHAQWIRCVQLKAVLVDAFAVDEQTLHVHLFEWLLRHDMRDTVLHVSACSTCSHDDDDDHTEWIITCGVISTRNVHNE